MLLRYDVYTLESPAELGDSSNICNEITYINTVRPVCGGWFFFIIVFLLNVI